ARDVTATAAAHALIAAGAERARSLAGEDDHPDRRILASAGERVGELHHRLGPEGIADLGPVDGDLRDAGVIAGGQLVADVLILAFGLPAGAHVCSSSGSDRVVPGQGTLVTAAAQGS